MVILAIGLLLSAIAAGRGWGLKVLWPWLLAVVAMGGYVVLDATIAAVLDVCISLAMAGILLVMALRPRTTADDRLTRVAQATSTSRSESELQRVAGSHTPPASAR